MNASDFFDAVFDSQCNTPAARYAMGMCTVDFDRLVARHCHTCGKESQWAGEHRDCPECRSQRARNHGTNSRYNKGCRCEPCTEAHRDYMRQWNRDKALREKGQYYPGPARVAGSVQTVKITPEDLAGLLAGRVPTLASRAIGCSPDYLASVRRKGTMEKSRYELLVELCSAS